MILNQLSDQEAKWFAIYTRFKAEKEVVRLLRKKRIEAYLPINRVVRQYTSKRKIVELPLINCYVFVHIVKNQYIPVLETSNVVKFIHFSKKIVPIPAAEIDLLRRICQEQMDLEVQPLSFQRGMQVEIIGGNLTGVSGKLVDKKGKNFLVELNHIGFGLRLEIEPSQMRKIGTAADNGEDGLGERWFDKLG